MPTEKQYYKALETVRLYEERISKLNEEGVLYGFLWFNQNETDFVSWINAKSIESAVKKFFAKKPKTMVRLDYEVQFGYTYINISDFEQAIDWI